MIRLQTADELVISFDIIGTGLTLELLNTIQRDTILDDCSYILSSYINQLHHVDEHNLPYEVLIQNYDNPYNRKYTEAVYSLLKDKIVGIDCMQEYVWFVFSIGKEDLFIQVDVDYIDDKKLVIQHILAILHMVIEHLDSLKWNLSKFTMKEVFSISPSYPTYLDYISLVAYTTYDGSVFQLESDKYYRATQDGYTFLLCEPSVHNKPINRTIFNKKLKTYLKTHPNNLT